jgi:TRAP-type C4-dicarboxylate transport system substrate-binding protein
MAIRQWLTGALAPLLLLPLVLLLFPGAPAQGAEIKIATVAPEGSSWMKDLRTAGQEIGKRTGGRVQLKFYGGGIQGNDKKVLRKIRIGQLQGGVFTSNGLAERYPDITLYGVPMLFENQAEVDYVRERLDPVLAKGLAEAGFESYGFAGGGFAYLMSGRPVGRLEELRGQKIWVPDGDRSSFLTMQALDLSPVVLPITDVLTGLETGLIDIVATPPVGAVVLQWYTKTRYITSLPLSYTMGLMAIDRRALRDVSPEDQAALREVMTALYRRLDRQNVQDNLKAEEALRSNGLRFVVPEAEEVPRWRNAVAGATERLATEGVVSPELLKQVRALVQEYRTRAAGAKAP